MKNLRKAIFFGSLLFVSVGVAACSTNIPRFGLGGQYEEGKDQFLRGRGGDMDKAVFALETVVTQNPTYKDSLTLLGRAYYGKTRYRDAFLILQRALAVRGDDEIAWLSLGLTELRLGQDEKGIETLKGAITLASKALVPGYLNYSEWDSKGSVRTALRRAAFSLTKGIDDKQNIIKSTETLLLQVDDEANYQRNDHVRQSYPLYGGN
jgi:tetratricopeptide (TPR) repeat protein